MKNQFLPLKHHIAIAALAAIAVFCFSCKNDIAEVNSLTSKNNTADETSTHLHLYSTVSGTLKYEFIFEKLLHYTSPEPYYESPKAFEVISYDENGEKELSLSADYGVNYEEKGIMEAKRNVIITNMNTQEVIETEHLIWNTKEHLIYSTSQIKQTKPDGSVYIGDRFESDEKMEKYTVYNPKIIFYAEEE